MMRAPANAVMATAYLSTFYDDLRYGMVDGEHKYIYEAPADALLKFHLPSDPYETTSLPIAEETRAAVIARLRSFRAHQQMTLRVAH